MKMKSNSNISLSVVIPTFNRHELLPRAIDSALNSSIYNTDVEVLVIPNGKDIKWRSIEEKYSSDPRVTFYFCPISHGNAARNLGLLKSKGTYIRFLDDDDYLYCEAAKKQLVLAFKEDLDWVSSRIEIIDKNHKFGLCSFPDIPDLLSAVMPVSGMSLPTGNLIKRDKIKIKWDESINRSQDYVFLLDLVMSGVYKWKNYNEIVGCWYQHTEFRVSDNANTVNYVILNKIEEYRKYLEINGVFTPSRKEHYSKAIWDFLYANYEKDKSKLYSIAKLKIAEGFYYNNLFKRNKLTMMAPSFLKNKPIFLLKLKWLIAIILRKENTLIKRI